MYLVSCTFMKLKLSLCVVKILTMREYTGVEDSCTMREYRGVDDISTAREYRGAEDSLTVRV